jgi:hypothetical protein
LKLISIYSNDSNFAPTVNENFFALQSHTPNYFASKRELELPLAPSVCALKLTQQLGSLTIRAGTIKKLNESADWLRSSHPL